MKKGNLFLVYSCWRSFQTVEIKNGRLSLQLKFLMSIKIDIVKQNVLVSFVLFFLEQNVFDTKDILLIKYNHSVPLENAYDQPSVTVEIWQIRTHVQYIIQYFPFVFVRFCFKAFLLKSESASVTKTLSVCCNIILIYKHAGQKISYPCQNFPINR